MNGAWLPLRNAVSMGAYFLVNSIKNVMKNEISYDILLSSMLYTLSISAKWFLYLALSMFAKFLNFIMLGEILGISPFITIHGGQIDLMSMLSIHIGFISLLKHVGTLTRLLTLNV